MGTFRFPFAVSLMMILFTTTNLWTSVAFEAFFNKSTTSFDVAIGDGREEEEFLMESDVSSRLVATKHITYDGLDKPSVCNAKIYGNCIVPISGNTRPCTYYNRCKRGSS